MNKITNTETSKNSLQYTGIVVTCQQLVTEVAI